MAETSVCIRKKSRKSPSVIRQDGTVAYVSLSRGFEATIDAADIELVKGHRWVSLIMKDGHAYAVRYEDGRCILMHRAILGAPVGRIVSHEDGDGLNNRRKNIQIATHTEGMARKAVERRNKLQTKGVSPHKRRFRARITPNGKVVNLGCYATKEEAAAAYRGAAIALWGKFVPKK